MPSRPPDASVAASIDESALTEPRCPRNFRSRLSLHVPDGMVGGSGEQLSAARAPPTPDTHVKTLAGAVAATRVRVAVVDATWSSNLSRSQREATTFNILTLTNTPKGAEGNTQLRSQPPQIRPFIKPQSTRRMRGRVVRCERRRATRLIVRAMRPEIGRRYGRR